MIILRILLLGAGGNNNPNPTPSEGLLQSRRRSRIPERGEFSIFMMEV